MSKAEQRALEAYPSTSHYWNAEPDSNASAREFFKQGYHQAEKDLELTWKDMSFIRLVFDALEANINLGAIKIQPMTKEFYEEVLEQFKLLKKYDTRRVH